MHQRCNNINLKSKIKKNISDLFFLDQGCYTLTKKASTTDRPNTTPIAILTTTPSPDL